jgi:hypothetical protein
LIGQNDLGLRVRAWRPAYDRDQPRVDRLGERCDVFGDLIFSRIVIDAKVLRLDRFPQKLRVARRACTRTGRDENRDDGQENGEAEGQAASV